MNEAFFAYLDNTGLANDDQRKLAEILLRKSRNQLITLCDELEALIPIPKERAASPFEFLANGTYAGGRDPCASTDCRTDRMREMAYFAALYADKVWIPSPFSHLKGCPVDDEYRFEILFFLHRLQRMRPLFEANLLALTPSEPANLCLGCYANLVGQYNPGFAAKFADLRAALNERIVSEVEFYVETKNKVSAIFPRGPSNLVDEHFGAYILRKAPRAVMQAARSAKKKQKLLSRDFVRKHNIPKMLFNDVLMDIANQNYYSTRFGTGYLTQRQLDLDLVNALSAKPVRDTNALLSEAFTHEIPVVAGVNLKDLIRIRLNEGDAFQIYRDALAKAINDAKGEDPRKLRQVFRDVVNPELNRLNGALASARKTLVRDSLLAGGVASGLVGVGLFSGILPPNLSAIVTLLGGYHFFEKTTTKLAQIVLEPNDARKNSYYFLWKVARHARKS